MVSVVVRGIITPERKLELDLPGTLEPGQVEVEIRQSIIQGITLQELLDSDLVGIWKGRHDIQDSVEFSRSLRQRASRRNLE
jgi:hypothetical protein